MKKTNLETYWYESQIKNHIIQFLAIFSELKVSVGVGKVTKEGDLAEVKVAYGSRDRVVNAIFADNTQNKPIRLPMISGYMIGLELDPSLRKGVGTEFRYTNLPRGGNINTDVRTVQEVMAIPYRVRMEASIYCSNTEQSLQILEQIMTMFDPQLQIQTSDNRYDNSRITTVELESISPEESYPAGTNNRVLIHTLIFNFPIYLRRPKNIINNVIKRIFVKIDSINQEFRSVEEKANDMTTDGRPYEKIIDILDFNLPEN